MKFILWFLRRLKKPKIKSKIMLKDNRPLLRNFKKILKKISYLRIDQSGPYDSLIEHSLDSLQRNG